VVCCFPRFTWRCWVAWSCKQPEVLAEDVFLLAEEHAALEEEEAADKDSSMWACDVCKKVFKVRVHAPTLASVHKECTAPCLTALHMGHTTASPPPPAPTQSEAQFNNHERSKKHREKLAKAVKKAQKASPAKQSKARAAKAAVPVVKQDEAKADASTEADADADAEADATFEAEADDVLLDDMLLDDLAGLDILGEFDDVILGDDTMGVDVAPTLYMTKKQRKKMRKKQLRAQRARAREAKKGTMDDGESTGGELLLLWIVLFSSGWQREVE